MVNRYENASQKKTYKKDYKEDSVVDRYKNSSIKKQDENNRGGLIGGLEYVGSKFVSGAGGILEGTYDNTMALANASIGNTEKAKAYYKKNLTSDYDYKNTEKYNPNGAMNFIGDIAQGVGNSSVFLLNTIANPVGTIAFFGGAIGQGISSATQKTGEVGAREIAYGVFSGATEGALELVSGAGGKVAKTLASSLGKGTSKAVSKGLVRKIGGEMAGEFMEEFLGDWTDVMWQRVTGVDKNASTTMKDALYSGLVGALSAGVMSSPATAVDYYSNQSRGKQAFTDGQVENVIGKAKIAVERYKSDIKDIESIDPSGTAIQKAKTNFNKFTAKHNLAKYIGDIEADITAFESLKNKNSARGYELIGEMQANVYYAEATALVDSISDNIRNMPDEQLAEVAKQINENYKPEKAVTVDDIKNGESSVATEIAIKEIAGYYSNQMTDEEFAQSFKEGFTPESNITSQAESYMPSETEKASYDNDTIDSVIERNNFNDEIARDMRSNFRPDVTGQTEGEYANAFERAVVSGARKTETSIYTDDAQDSIVARMDKNARDTAHLLGKAFKDEINKKADEKLEKQRKSSVDKKNSRSSEPKSTGVRFATNIDQSTLSNKRKVAVESAEILSKALGIQFNFYKSERRGEKIIWYDMNGQIVRGKDGKPLPAPNGMFCDGNVIYLDINAGANFDGLTLYTIGHELTHYIREWSPEKFEQLSEFLRNEYAEENISFDKLISEEIEKQKASGRIKAGMSYDEVYDRAYEEVVADSMETMLQDGVVLDRLNKEHKNIFKKIASFVKDAITRIKDAFKGMVGGTNAGILAHTIDANKFNQLENLFADALIEASQRANENGLNADSFREVDITSEAFNEDGENLFQWRAVAKDIDGYKNMMKGFLEEKEYNELFDEEKGLPKVLEVFQQFADYLDFGTENSFMIDEAIGRQYSPVKDNADKLYKVSVDFSTLCRKRILQTIIKEKLEERLNRSITKAEAVAIRGELKILKESLKTIEVACGLCYVESARLKSFEQIQSFLKNPSKKVTEYLGSKDSGIKSKKVEVEQQIRKENRVAIENAIKKAEEEGDIVNYSQGKDKPRDYTTVTLGWLKSHGLGKLKDSISEAKSRLNGDYVVTPEQQKEIDWVRDEAKATDFTTVEGLGELSRRHPIVYSAYVSTIVQATKSKGIEGDTYWRLGDSQSSISDGLIEAMNAENGLRSQSWSDFQVMHLLDYIASTIELSQRGAKMQVYTKVEDYVRLQGNTGAMINLSLIPSKNFNGSLGFDSVEGMDFETAKRLRNAYPATAGTISIGMKDEQIFMLLSDGDIDYIIPYHKSAMPSGIMSHMDIPEWSSYENYQNEKAVEKGQEAKYAREHGGTYKDKFYMEKGKQKRYDEVLFSEWFNLAEARRIAEEENQKAKDGNATYPEMYKKYGVMYGGYVAMHEQAEKYKKLCYERGLMPKFSYVKNDVDFSKDFNYWKLLIDRKMINNKTGEIIEQKPVRPTYNFDDIYVGQDRISKGVPAGIIDKALENYQQIHDEQEEAINTIVSDYMSGKMNDYIASISKALRGGQSVEDLIKEQNKLFSNAKKNGEAMTLNSIIESSKHSDREPLKTLKGYDIKRSKYGVGKKMNNQIYVHKNYATDVIPTEIYQKAVDILPKDFEFNCVMYDISNPNVVRFDEAPDFDTAREPKPNSMVFVDVEEGKVINESSSNMVWHHKWLWVKDDYKGFDVDESYNWSKEWLKKITSPSGSLRVWNKALTENGLPIDLIDNTLYSDRILKQEHTSADTSINSTKIPSLYTNKNAVFVNGGVNIDIGAGKFDTATNYLAEKGVKSLPFDPFNRKKSVNSEVVDFLKSGNKADTATCSNVLNVIDTAEGRANVILQMAKSIKEDGVAYFTVYENKANLEAGKAGQSKNKPDQWQEFRATKTYVEEIKRYFDNVFEPKGGLIIAKEPKKNLPEAVWQLSDKRGTVGEAEDDFVMYSDRDSDGNELSKGQQDFFKNSKFRDADGNLMVLYHGSNRGGFMSFNTDVIFLTDDFERASSYAKNSNVVSGIKFETAQELYDFINSESGYIFFNEDPYLSGMKIKTAQEDEEIREAVKYRIEIMKKISKEKQFPKIIIDRAEESLTDGTHFLMLNGEIEGEYKTDEEALRSVIPAIYDYQHDAKDILSNEDYLDYDDKYYDDEDDDSDETDYYTSNIYTVYANCEKPLVINCHGRNFLQIMYRGERMTTDEIAKKVKSEGVYDGIIFKNIMDNGEKDYYNELGIGDVYVVFNSNQVKDLQNDVPTNDSDIRYSERNLYNRFQLTQALKGVKGLTDFQKQFIDRYTDDIIKYTDYVYMNDDIKYELSKANKELADNKAQMTQVKKDNKSMTYTFADSEMRAIQNRIDSINDRISNLKEQQKIVEHDMSETLSKMTTRENEKTTLDVINSLTDYMNGLEISNEEKDSEIKNIKDINDKTIKELKAQNRKKVSELIHEKNDRYDGLKKHVRELAKKAVDSRRRTAVRADIFEVVGNIGKLLLSNDKKKHVPVQLRQATVESLLVLNRDTQNARERIMNKKVQIDEEKNGKNRESVLKKLNGELKNLEDLAERIDLKIETFKNAYGQLKTSSNGITQSMFDETINDRLEWISDELNGKPIANMNLEELKQVLDTYKMVYHAIVSANKAFSDNIKKNIEAMSVDVMSEVSKSIKNDKELSQLRGLKRFGWSLLKPSTAFEVINSETLKLLYDNMRDGEDKFAKDIMEAKEYWKGLSKKYNYDSWDMNKQYTFNTMNGEVKLTLGQILSLYAYSKRKQALKHLQQGGFIFDSNEEVIVKFKDKIPLKYSYKDARAYALGEAEGHLDKIVQALTDEQREFVDEAQEYLSKDMARKGNEVSVKLYNVELFGETYYFPLVTASEYRPANTEASKYADLKNMGMTKPTVPNASNPIVLSDFSKVWSNHARQMSLYHSMTIPVEDFRRVYDFHGRTEQGVDVSVKEKLASAFDGVAGKYIENLLKGINGGVRSTDTGTNMMDRMISMFKRSATMANFSVAIQQWTAIARAFAYIDPKYFGTMKQLNAKAHGEMWEELKKYAPVAIIKEMGSFDTGVGVETANWITAKEYTGLKDKSKAFLKDKDYRNEVLSFLPAYIDEVTWIHIWEACKNEQRALNPSASEETIKENAGKRFTQIITKSQVYDSVFSRSDIMRSKDTGVKMATAFMSETTTSLNMLVEAIFKGKRGDMKQARKNIGFVIASLILNSLVVSLVKASRDDDDEKTYLEKYTGTAVAEVVDSVNPLSMIPFVKDIVSIAQGYKVERSDMTVVKNIYDAFTSLDSSNKSVYRKVEDSAGNIAQIFGLPVKNVMRDMRSVKNIFSSSSQTTSKGIGIAIQEELVQGNPLLDLLFGKDTSDGQQLYEAYVSNDANQYARVLGRYSSAEKAKTALKQALRENDDRILQATDARIKGDIAGYTNIVNQIISEGMFDKETVVGAINSQISKEASMAKATAEQVEEEEEEQQATEYSIYKNSDINTALDNGDYVTAKAVIKDLVATKMANGVEEKEAISTIRSSITAYWKKIYLQAYKSGNSTEMRRIREILRASGVYGDSSSEIQKVIASWINSIK